MDTPELVERLAAIPDLSDVPRDQLIWLVEHGRLHAEDDGFRIFSIDEFVGLVLLISGRLSIRTVRDGVEREVREITPGRPTGFLPYSKMKTPRGYAVADGPVEFLFIRKEDLAEMTRACYEFTAKCVQEMLARVRVFKADDKHQEKMAALGRLSAGLAHELNNPASAVARGAGELEASRIELVASARALAAAGLDEAGLAVLDVLEAAIAREPGEALSPVERATAEDAVLDWLERHGVDPDLAYPLTERSITVEDLERAASSLGPDQLGVVLRYVGASATVRGLEIDIFSASTRIHSLVAAVKKHTHMDRAPAIQPIGLEQHLADTVTLLSSKASARKLSLDLSVEADLPPVMGQVADLNQVWMHLVDNAIDAAPEAGRITIDARYQRGCVHVSVVDDGPGIPDEDRERVFDPFFTTKDVSQGRGLGLDIVRTVVRSHRGIVDLDSKPGRTEFRVTLPVAGDDAGAP